jgi:hypothetical protein
LGSGVPAAIGALKEKIFAAIFRASQNNLSVYTDGFFLKFWHP